MVSKSIESSVFGRLKFWALFRFMQSTTIFLLGKQDVFPNKYAFHRIELFCSDFKLLWSCRYCYSVDASCPPINIAWKFKRWKFLKKIKPRGMGPSRQITTEISPSSSLLCNLDFTFMGRRLCRQPHCLASLRNWLFLKSLVRLSSILVSHLALLYSRLVIEYLFIWA